MVSTGAGLIISLLFVGALYTTEAAITGWSNPTSTDGAATPTIPENTAVGSTGVTIEATANGSITYAIGTQPTAGKLTIDTSSGLLSLAAGNSFDFETEPTYVLTVIATDGGDNATDTATVTLSITNVNEAPTFATAQTSATVPAASKGGTSVTTVSASDVDKDDSVTYTISGTGTAPIVKESDPVFSASYSPCIADKSPAGTTLTTVAATVKDSTDTFTYTISSGDPGKNFTIDPNSGLIKVNVGKTLNKAETPSYNLIVTAADKVVTTKTGTTTVSVTVADFCENGDNGDSGAAVAGVSVLMLIVSLFVTLF